MGSARSRRDLGTRDASGIPEWIEAMGIDSKTLEHDGFTVRIDVVPDEDATPHDAECYSTDEIDAWARGEWSYVGYVYTASREGVELGTASIWGSEWGFPGNDSSIDAWIAENYYHPDLLAESVSEARAVLARLTPAA